MMWKKIVQITVLIVVLSLPGMLLAVVHDYASSVNKENGNASPDVSSSQVNNYVYQDEQINLDPNSGTIKVLRTDQKVNTNKFVTDLVQFKNANPRELRHAFRVICGKEGGNADVLQDKVKKEYFLQVVCPEFQLPYLKAAAEALDVAWLKVGEDGDANLYYKAKFRPVKDLWWISQYYRSWEGYFMFDTTNNALYYNDEPACFGLQTWGLQQIDIPPSQVLLEVSVYEINAQNDLKLGLDWIDWKNGPGRNLFEGIFSSLQGEYNSKHELYGFTDVIDDSWGSDYRYLSVEALITSEFMDFLQVKGKAREMSRITLLAQSGHTAWTETIDRVVAINAQHYNSSYPYQESPDRNPYASDYYRYGVPNLPQAHDRFVNFIQSGQVGVYVGLLPFVGQKSMELSVCAEASSVTGIDANGLPVIDSRSVDTKVRLADGEPFVLAGLKRTAAIKRSAKVPILGSIPVLGWLFGNEININRDNNVLIVVKPKFLLGTASDFEMAEEAKTIIAQAKGEETLEIPKNKWGFDQWLMDADK
jgi:type II secretory pathway component GspD/PulD (secretin)